MNLHDLACTAMPIPNRVNNNTLNCILFVGVRSVGRRKEFSALMPWANRRPVKYPSRAALPRRTPPLGGLEPASRECAHSRTSDRSACHGRRGRSGTGVAASRWRRNEEGPLLEKVARLWQVCCKKGGGSKELNKTSTKCCCLCCWCVNRQKIWRGVDLNDRLAVPPPLLLHTPQIGPFLECLRRGEDKSGLGVKRAWELGISAGVLLQTSHPVSQFLLRVCEKFTLSYAVRTLSKIRKPFKTQSKYVPHPFFMNVFTIVWTPKGFPKGPEQNVASVFGPAQ